MTKDRKVLYTASLILVAVFLGVLFIPRSLIRSIAAAISAAAAVAIFFIIKKRAIYSINKQQVLLLTSVAGVLYLVAYYLTGIEYGFYRVRTPFSVATFFKFVLPIAVIIISTEIIRSILLAQKNKLSSTCSFIACILSELIIGAGLTGSIRFDRFMDIVALTLLPAVAANVLYHFLSKHYGAYPGIAYRLITSLYIYFLPVAPSTHDALVSLANLLVPLLILIFVKSLYENKQRAKAIKSGKKKWIEITVILLTVSLMISLVMLISCKFRYGTLVVATESMTGKINKGDAVVFERYDEQIISEGQVIVFRDGDNLVVHRVVEIQRIDGSNRYFTKGDANEDRDSGYITDSDIASLVLFKVSYVGYPSIWIRSIFNK